jgi:hypothetical protein
MLTGSCLCGAVAYEVDAPARDHVLLRLGCLDTPVTEKPAGHIWRSDAASWYDPKDILPEAPEGTFRSPARRNRGTDP